jgi:hypothetical protein
VNTNLANFFNRVEKFNLTEFSYYRHQYASHRQPTVDCRIQQRPFDTSNAFRTGQDTQVRRTKRARREEGSFLELIVFSAFVSVPRASKKCSSVQQQAGKMFHCRDKRWKA